MLIEKLISVQENTIITIAGELWKTRALQAIMDKDNQWFESLALILDDSVKNIDRSFGNKWDFSIFSQRLDCSNISKELLKEYFFHIKLLNGLKLLYFIGSQCDDLVSDNIDSKLNIKVKNALDTIKDAREANGKKACYKACIQYA